MATMQYKSFGDFNVADYSNFPNFSSAEISNLSFQEYQALKEKSKDLSYNEYMELLNKTREEKQKIQNNMKYKIFNVKDLLAEIQYEGVRKGTKTEAYLEDVIASVNRSGKYRWVQFFQLVDVFYIVVQVLETTTKNSQEETKDHYANVEPAVLKSEPVRNELKNVNNELKSEPVKNQPTSFSKTSFPWKQ
jgi:hypothetical protein